MIIRCAKCGDTEGPWGRANGVLVCEHCLPPRACQVCKGHREVLLRTLEPDTEWTTVPCICTNTGPLIKQAVS